MASERTLGNHAARITNLEKTVTKRFDGIDGRLDGLDDKVDMVLLHQAERRGEIKVIKWLAGGAASLSGAVAVAFAKTKGWVGAVLTWWVS